MNGSLSQFLQELLIHGLWENYSDFDAEFHLNLPLSLSPFHTHSCNLPMGHSDLYPQKPSSKMLFMMIMDAEPALLFFFGIFGRGGVGDLLQTTIQSLWPLTSILPSELDILENDCGTSCGVAYENSTWLDPIEKKKNKKPRTPKQWLDLKGEGNDSVCFYVRAQWGVPSMICMAASPRESDGCG